MFSGGSGDSDNDRTILFTVNGNQHLVRCSRDIRIISALDPETALLPLDQPLLSTEEHALRWGGHDTVKVTAGIHRAVWVAGTAAYVDVNVINNTKRAISRIKCKLRRYILAYKEVSFSRCKSPCRVSNCYSQLPWPKDNLQDILECPVGKKRKLYLTLS